MTDGMDYSTCGSALCDIAFLEDISECHTPEGICDVPFSATWVCL